MMHSGNHDCRVIRAEALGLVWIHHLTDVDVPDDKDGDIGRMVGRGDGGQADGNTLRQIAEVSVKIVNNPLL